MIMGDKLANPAPLGLLGFGMTTVLLNIHNAGIYPLGSMILAMGLVYGGLENTLGTVIASGLMVVGSLVFSIAVTWKPSRDLIFGWMEKLISRMKK